jgi:CDP-diacylglycerol--glycerol-3-phosphate 3-phosphatidyltransferase
VRCLAVGRRVHGHGADPELAQAAEDPDRDLAAVGDEHLPERRLLGCRHGPYSLEAVTLPDQLTVARAASVPLVVLLYAWELPNNEALATALFCIAMATDWFDGRIARRRGTTSSLGSLLDPIADKVLVLAVLVVLIEDAIWPGWMVAAIVARELAVSGLRLAAMERGVVIAARDLGKLKTWAQAIAAAIGGFAAAGWWRDDIAWWALLVALVLTWVSGLDYARIAPRVLRGAA